jgi:uroporphyrin-III C-methyltransferase/precorrin-2 dehydrogenase/sirohydrochlorin ferrochelatase
MAFMSYLPIFLKSDFSSPVLIVGGGLIATAKTEALVSADVHVDVVANEICQELIQLCEQQGFSYHQVSYDSSLLSGHHIVIAATDEDEINQLIAADCRAQGILVNVVDNPLLCDFIFPALIKRGPLQIAISSSGISPVLARLIKQAIELLIPARYESLINFLQDKKSAIRQRLTRLQPRRLFYEYVLRSSIAEDVLEGNINRANQTFDNALQGASNMRNASLYLVGTGPGNPDLLTLKAVRLLGQADVILYDRLIPQGVLEQYGRKDAKKIAVGKTRHHHHKKQHEIDGIIEHHLTRNRIVLRLKGGDPGIYAHGAEEIAVAKKLNVPYQIVPGVTAANACAAYAGIPLTERGGAESVRLMTIYKDQINDDRFWEKFRHSQTETLVLYMSSNNYSTLCRKLIELGFSPKTPLLVVEQGTTTHQKDYPATLDSFDVMCSDYQFASPCLMIVGDVVKWHAMHAWKQSSLIEGNYFSNLPVKEIEHA